MLVCVWFYLIGFGSSVPSTLSSSIYSNLFSLHRLYIKRPSPGYIQRILISHHSMTVQSQFWSSDSCVHFKITFLFGIFTKFSSNSEFVNQDIPLEAFVLYLSSLFFFPGVRALQLCISKWEGNQREK